MTEPATHEPVAALSFTSPDATPRELTPIDLDGEMLYAVIPKGGMMLELAIRAASAGDDLAQAQLVDDFLTLVMEEESAARIRERLTDPDDPFDVEPTLVEMINGLQALWGKGRSTKSRPSSARRRRTGPRSTATARRGG